MCASSNTRPRANYAPPRPRLETRALSREQWTGSLSPLLPPSQSLAAATTDSPLRIDSLGTENIIGLGIGGGISIVLNRGRSEDADVTSEGGTRAGHRDRRVAASSAFGHDRHGGRCR